MCIYLRALAKFLQNVASEIVDLSINAKASESGSSEFMIVRGSACGLSVGKRGCGNLQDRR